MDSPELETLYLRYRTDVYRYLCSLTRDPTEAEDLLSETFLRVLRRLSTFRGECDVKIWLFGIARNVWLESLRSRHRHPTVSTEDLLECWLADDSFAAQTDTRLLLRHVQELLQKKDERTQTVVRMRAQGYTYAEIARTLQITENSARVIEHRTRAWLRDILEKEGCTDA